MFAAGVPAVAALTAAAMPATVAHGAPTTTSEPPPGVVRVRVADLRDSDTTDSSAAYYITDTGLEGVYTCDPGDSASVDDLGLVLVTASGLRFKRVYSGPLNVRWFGAKADGINDDAGAIQAAVDRAQAIGAAVYLPATPTHYAIGSAISIDSAKPGIRIFGDAITFPGGKGATLIKPHTSVTKTAPLDAIFKFSDTVGGKYFEFDHFTINADWRCTHGIYSATISHTAFRRITIMRTTVGALALGYGWCNDVENCELLYNDGDGFLAVGEQLNVLNIVNSKLFNNGGIGINLEKSALGVRITGCTIEQNKKCGIVATNDTQPLDISSNYFEANGAIGYQFTSPARLVKANVIVNGTASAATVGSDWPCGPTRLASNFVNIGETNCFVAAYCSSNSLEVTGTTLLRNSAVPKDYAVVVTGTGSTGNGALVENVRMYGNGVFPPQRSRIRLRQILVEDLGGPCRLHDSEIDGIFRANYSAPLSKFLPLSTPTTGRLRKVTRKFHNHPSHELSDPRDSATYWGFTLDMADHPELAGKCVYFASAVSAISNDSTVTLRCHSVDIEQTINEAQGWLTMSAIVVLPESGTVNVGIRATSTSPFTRVLFAHPVLAEVGARYSDQDRAHE